MAGLYVLHLHLHGLFRSHDLELGRDPDTGGQTTYVLELARALMYLTVPGAVPVIVSVPPVRYATYSPRFWPPRLAVLPLATAPT